MIYVYAGPDVTSPALGSASTVVGKVAYGVALPTVSYFGSRTGLCPLEVKRETTNCSTQIIIGGVVNGHVASKYVYVRVFRGTDRIHKKDIIAVGSWVGITLGLWVVAWVIASAIPVFNNLLSLIVPPPDSSHILVATGC